MVDFKEVKRAANGRWPGIYERLGVDVGQGKHQACPVCSNGEPKSDRFRFTNEKGDGEWYCNQCTPHAGDGFSLLQKVLGFDFMEVCKVVAELVGTIDPAKPPPEKKVTADFMRKIYKESQKTSKGDVVHRYLVNRGLSVIPNDIRTTMKCWEPETKKEVPAMLAVFRLPDGTAVTMHRVFLTKDGNKMNILSPKKTLPPMKPMAGGAVRLFDITEDLLFVCEGIETGIAIHETMKVPVWATLSASLLTGWVPPKEAQRIVVCGDNDKNFTGQAAAYDLANRLIMMHHKTVDVMIPEKQGTDFLDEIKKG